MAMKKTDVDLSMVQWRRSSAGGTADPAVEIAFLDEGYIAMRDSRNPSGPELIFTPEEWSVFLSGVDNAEFDRP
ncbi:DUF397 domain-containing protein [Nocardia gipuzkoensis]|uniref:DUF397 domain-containing protein n=1 Tax=Nocardia gipuzkoensis TaxID=2749991 RepID=UPI00237DB5B1|nr:DUF397 domain-containing protein [Nocardia gipuzkoensis]MDE1675460.1 DUF397 domain-containing protein [Nocardia gipuzkoensis]